MEINDPKMEGSGGEVQRKNWGWMGDELESFFIEGAVLSCLAKFESTLKMGEEFSEKNEGGGINI